MRHVSVRGLLCWIAIAITTGCTTSVPSDIAGVRELGEDTVLYDGPGLSAGLDLRQARRSLGSDHLVIEVDLGGRSTEGVIDLDRTAFSIRTPDRRVIPMMTRGEFRDAYRELGAAAIRVEFQPVGPANTRVMDAPCVDWYFRRPHDGLARDTLRISAMRPCRGPLFFHVPGGVQPGRWELEIRLEESTAEIPFTLSSE